MEGDTRDEPVKDLNELQNADWVRRRISLHQAPQDVLEITHRWSDCVSFLFHQARFWVQVMRDLRNGVKLKKVQERQYNPLPIEYQLTPYEMLMDDIRSKRYKLRKVMVRVSVAARTGPHLPFDFSLSCVCKNWDLRCLWCWVHAFVTPGERRHPSEVKEERTWNHPGIHPIATAAQSRE